MGLQILYKLNKEHLLDSVQRLSTKELLSCVLKFVITYRKEESKDLNLIKDPTNHMNIYVTYNGISTGLIGKKQYETVNECLISWCDNRKYQWCNSVNPLMPAESLPTGREIADAEEEVKQLAASADKIKQFALKEFHKRLDDLMEVMPKNKKSVEYREKEQNDALMARIALSAEDKKRAEYKKVADDAMARIAAGSAETKKELDASMARWLVEKANKESDAAKP